MPAGTNKNVAFIAVIAVLVPCLVGLWFAAPMFLPMYRWVHVDTAQIAAASGIPKAKLETPFKMRVRYNPRGEGDPLPWQIMSMDPPWIQVYPDAEDETDILVRCAFLSGNDGQPPGTTFINSTFKDRYFRVDAIRLPPGSLGQNAKRPVVVYDRMSLDKMSISDADMAHRTAQYAENDDLWPERDDGWSPPEAP
jgi:hypothetical protein